jgi:hypothetical protein
VPYRVHTVLTDNGVRFTDTLPADEDPEAEAAIDAIWAARGEPRLYRVHAFDHACERQARRRAQADQALPPVDEWSGRADEPHPEGRHRAPPPRRASHDELRAHLRLFLDAYNHARRLKALRGLTPYEFICHAWTGEPERFRLTPLHPQSATPRPGTEHLAGRPRCP